ncbi:hypothetical protein B0813_001498 [Candidatus Fervidibacteria bacterium JGI MDM2 SSWTFF-3-K9]
MRRLLTFGCWLFVIMSWGYGKDADHLRCTGVLKGYFLTSTGEVVLRSVNLTTQPISEQPKEEMYLLWAGYYFEGQIKSAKPIRHIAILADRHVVWKRELPKAILQGAVPDLKLPLQLHTRYGSDWKVRVGFEDGGVVELPLRPIGVRFRTPPPLKIDWLDLVRIRAIKNFLACYGDRLFPGWNAEQVPFALLGDDGQWVFVNHPKPPKGAKRYRGPSPLKVDIFWSDHLLEFDVPSEAAQTEKINGVDTVILPFRPYWFALPEYETKRNAAEAMMRLVILLHECFHAWYGQQPFQSLEISVPAYPLATGELPRLTDVLSNLESDLLNEALVTQDIDRRNEAIRQFLALRQLPPKPEYQSVVEMERIAELSEGVASVLTDQALELLMAQWQEYYPMLKVDPFLTEQPISLSLLWKSYPASPYFTGAAQLTLLERWGFDWKSHLRATGFRTPLDELLKKAIASKDNTWQEPSPEQQAQEAQALWRKVEGQLAAMKQVEEELQNDGFEEFRKRLRGEKLGLWVKVAFPEEILRDYPPPKVSLDGRWQESLNLMGWDFRMDVNRLCWVSQETMQSLVARFYLPMEKEEVVWFRWRGNDLEVRGEGLQLYVPQARLIKTKDCLWLVGQSRSLSGEKPLWIRRAINIKRSGWFAVSLAFLLAVSAKTHAQIPEGVTVNATATGLFRDADTGQIAYLTLDLLDEAKNPPGSWHTIVDEQYDISVVVESIEPELRSLILKDEDGREIARAESDQLSNRLQVQARRTPSHGCKWRWVLELRVVYAESPPPPRREVQLVLTEKHFPIPPPEYGQIHVRVYDGSNNQPLAWARIEIPEAKTTGQTGPDGTWTSQLLPASAKRGNTYTVIVTGPTAFSRVWCEVRNKVTLYSQGVYVMHVPLWPHCPIVGRIVFEGPGGDPQFAIVEAKKGNVTFQGIVNPDGTFVIPGGGGAPEAGEWTVTVKYPGAESITPPSRTVTVPNHCPKDATRPGSHSPVDAGTFTIKLPFPGGPQGG